MSHSRLAMGSWPRYLRISSPSTLDWRTILAPPRFHHIGIVVENLDAAIQEFTTLLGAAVVSPATLDPIQKVRVQFLRLADGLTAELIEPAGDDSPAAGSLKRGQSLAHLCYEVDDLDATLQEAKTSGGLVVRPALPAAAFEQRRIAFVFFRRLGVIEYVESERKNS